jgi:hypothetical protein
MICLTPILTHRPNPTWPKSEVGVQTPLHQQIQPEWHTTSQAQSTSIKHPVAKSQGWAVGHKIFGYMACTL